MTNNKLCLKQGINMNLKNLFKIMLSVGLGLISGSLLIYLVSSINFNRIESKKYNKNFSKIANVDKKIIGKAITSKRVVRSKNNRYLKLANYPIVKADVQHYPSIKQIGKLKTQGKNLEINIKIKEMNDRGYVNSNTVTPMKVYIVPGLKSCKYEVIDGDLVITTNRLFMLKSRTFINGDLYVKGIDFLKLPTNLYVNGNIYVINSKGLLINENTIINGHVVVSGVSSLRHMFDSVKIVGQVFIKS